MKKKLLLLITCCIIAQQVNGMVHFQPRNTPSNELEQLNNIIFFNNVEQFKNWIKNDNTDINIKDDHGNTSLHAAAMNNCKEIVKILLENDADITAKNKHHDTPLHVATMNNCKETVQILLENGADITAENKHHNTPLHIAASGNHSELISILLNSFIIRKGKNIFSRISTRSVTGEPLTSSHEYNEFINAKVFNSGDTSLHIAARHECPDALKTLIEHGADISTPDLQGNTPLHTAAKHDSLDEVKILLKYGARKHLKNAKGKTPSDLATTDEIKELLKKPQVA